MTLILSLFAALIGMTLTLMLACYLAVKFFAHLEQDEGAGEAFESFMKRLLFPPKEKKPEEPSVEAADGTPGEKEVF